MASCLPDDLVKDFAKQMSFYNTYQARKRSAVCNREPSFWWTNQTSFGFFLVKEVWG